ncbi:putative bifunctional diguanylate cyclase/phosphodiesterase [Aquifex pyrophilus]
MFKYAGIFKKEGKALFEKGELTPEDESICIPLDDDYFLTVAKEKGDEFSNEELVLLYEVANDLAFALNRLKEKGKAQFTDRITGLPNRFSFFEKLRKLMKERRLKALVLVDIDNFHEINTAFGFEAGNRILKEVARRLSSFGYFTARITNDEFGMLLPKESKPLQEFLKKVMDALSLNPYEINGRSIYITFSAGGVEVSEDFSSPEEIYTFALRSLREAKELGGNTFVIAVKKEDNIEERARERVLIRSELIRAIREKEFRLLYQPKVDLKSEKIIGAEALIRWIKGSEVIPPNKFIPLLEESLLIHDVGLWVLEEACNFLKNLKKKGVSIPIAVNLSPVQLRSETFFRDIESKLKDCKDVVNLLEFEVTEGAIMENPENAIKLLEKITELGIRIYIDDFGTKYASLSYLKRIPAYALKIDISFIRNLPKDEDDLKMVKAIILLAKTFNLKTVAEGIETKEQLEVLRELGCDYGQGYYFSKPVPEEEFIKLLEKNL